MCRAGRQGSAAVAAREEPEQSVLKAKSHSAPCVRSGGDACRGSLWIEQEDGVEEASLGLAPLVVDRTYTALRRLVERGMSLVVVEQYVHKALELANTVCILSRGEVVHVGNADDISTDDIYNGYLGIES